MQSVKENEVEATVKPVELNQRLKTGNRFLLVDVRSPEEFASGHVPCAVNLPQEQVISRLNDLAGPDPIVLICQTGRRAAMAKAIVDAHVSNAFLLEGGTKAWIEAGLPVVRVTKTTLPLMRQVQLVAGPMILVGVVLALTVNPWWSLLAGVAGAGLTLAGATGFCGLGILLQKMPWNRAKSPSCFVK